MIKLIKEILTGDNNRYSIKKFIALLSTFVYCTVGILDASVKGVDMDSEFYWVTVFLICAMVAARSIETIAQVRTGKSIIRTESSTTITSNEKEES